jgi:hypothetical protein
MRSKDKNKVEIAKRSYEIVFTATVKVIKEAGSVMDAVEIARESCPKGFKVSEVNAIRSREQYRTVKNHISSQFEIPILI